MKPVFISYVRENKKVVDRLHQKLTSQGIEVWLDRQDLGPGVRWKRKIRKAISDGAFFIACFSKEYHEREKTYMNEELIVAIEELRQLHVDRVWFIPVRLDGREIPDIDIGRGETLEDLNYVNLYEDWEAGIQSIFNVIQPEISSGQEVPPSMESASDVYSEAIGIASDGNLHKWRQLLKRVRPNVFKSLVGWGNNELVAEQQVNNEEELVNEAVDIVSPLISAALAGVESDNDQFKDQKSMLKNLLSISDSNLDSHLTWDRIRYTLGYVYHSLHGAISLSIGQIDLALDLARIKVEYYNRENFRKLWKAPPFMGWSKLIGNNGCTEGWKYVASTRNRCEWLIPIFPDESEYRVSLVAYYMALHIHELASVIASGEQDTLNTNSLKILCVPLTFVSEGRDINRRAISLLHSNPEALTILWSCLDVTRMQMEDSWEKWIEECENWLTRVYGFAGYREIYHEYFFKSF